MDSRLGRQFSQDVSSSLFLYDLGCRCVLQFLPLSLSMGARLGRCSLGSCSEPLLGRNLGFSVGSAKARADGQCRPPSVGRAGSQVALHGAPPRAPRKPWGGKGSQLQGDRLPHPLKAHSLGPPSLGDPQASLPSQILCSSPKTATKAVPPNVTSLSPSSLPRYFIWWLQARPSLRSTSDQQRLKHVRRRGSAGLEESGPVPAPYSSHACAHARIWR